MSYLTQLAEQLRKAYPPDGVPPGATGDRPSIDLLRSK